MPSLYYPFKKQKKKKKKKITPDLRLLFSEFRE